METLRVKTGRRTQLVDVTAAVERVVTESGVVSGVCYVYVPHTTAGVGVIDDSGADVGAGFEGGVDPFVARRGAFWAGAGGADLPSSGGFGGGRCTWFLVGGG